jgi:hypothetical protein
MAQAQVVISAVDRTQAALNSATRSIKNLERNAKTMGKVINTAFALVSGRVLLQGFNNLATAISKTDQAQKGFAQTFEVLKKSANDLMTPTTGLPGATEAMKELAATLKDPGVLAAADAITSALITGFVKAFNLVAEFATFVRRTFISLGAGSPVSAGDVGSIIEGQIRANIFKMQDKTRGGRRSDVDLSELKEQNSLLEKQLGIIRGLAEQERQATLAQIESDIEKIKSLKLFEESRKAALASTLAATDPLEDYYQKAIENIRQSAIDMGDAIATELEGIEAPIIKGLDDSADYFKIFGETAAANIQTAFADFLFDPFQNGLRGMLRGFVDTVRRMVAELASQALLKQFFGWMSGLGGFWGTLGTALAGARAMGGPVSSGKTYLVGERGPELFTPATSGAIIPNHAMGGGITVSPVYNIDARGATQELQNALPGILQENNRRIFDELDRRYRIGR